MSSAITTSTVGTVAAATEVTAATPSVGISAACAVASAPREEVLTFPCGGETLVGILARPPEGVAARGVGVVIVVGGPQYRIGSHRQFVLLARRLASAGHPVLRFDVRGMGDSSGDARSFEALDDDVAAAIAALRGAVPSLASVALWGLCDGASAALLCLAATPSPAVGGVCLVNPWVRSAASLARTHVKHYYLRRLAEPAFWAKLLRGGVAGTALRDLFGNIRLARGGAAPSAGRAAGPYQARMAGACAAFTGPVLLLLSGDDYTAKEFLEYSAADPMWTNALQRPVLQRHDLPGVDHTFSTTAARRQVEALTLGWLEAVEAAAVRSRSREAGAP